MFRLTRPLTIDPFFKTCLSFHLPYTILASVLLRLLELSITFERANGFKQDFVPLFKTTLP